MSRTLYSEYLSSEENDYVDLPDLVTEIFLKTRLLISQCT